MIDEKFVILAVLINASGSFTYIRAALKGQVKPHKISWLLWSIIPLVIILAQISKAANWSALFTFSTFIGPLAIFLASFINKKADWAISKFDISCGVLSLLAIIFWFITKDPIVAIMLSILADIAAAMPTLIKSFYFPETEQVWAYLSACIAAAIVLLTFNTWDFTNVAYPIYVFLLCLALVILIKFKLGKIILSR